jgi:hypothetical protein
MIKYHLTSFSKLTNCVSAITIAVIAKLYCFFVYSFYSNNSMYPPTTTTSIILNLQLKEGLLSH